ncbi:MAG: hypothetical protein ACRCZI_10795 [Cetobacterium sp.]
MPDGDTFYDCDDFWADKEDPMPPKPSDPKTCPPSDPVNDCFQGCNDQAKMKQKWCKAKIKEFVESMKAQGCKGTSCSVKGLTKTCRRRKKAKRKPCSSKSKK